MRVGVGLDFLGGEEGRSMKMEFSRSGVKVRFLEGKSDVLVRMVVVAGLLLDIFLRCAGRG